MSVEVSERAHAAILLSVAARAISEARRAWKQAHVSSDVTSLRAAYRACLLAARTARHAAQARGRDAIEVARLTAEAEKLDAAAGDLKTKLVKAVVRTAAYSVPSAAS